MKKLLLPFLIAFASLVFAGCMETTEELTIAADGSGTYHVGMDMSGLFDLMDAMKAMDASGTENKKGEKMDTLIAMRDFADTASHLSAEQKALLQNAHMKMKMDEAAKEFKMDMRFPFAKIGDVTKLMQFSQSGGGNVMDNMLKGAPVAGNGGGEKMPDLNSYYDMVVTGNVIERKLNGEKYAAMQQGEQVKGMQQAGDMLESIKYNTVIHLPRPAKSIKGTHAQLSADKKTLTLKGTLQDLFQDPEAFSYRIEY